jgi:short-chain fatty acids transporter
MNSLSIGHVLMLLIHPFWCLPILCTFKVRFYDVVPYTFVLFILGVVVAHLGLLIQLL